MAKVRWVFSVLLVVFQQVYAQKKVSGWIVDQDQNQVSSVLVVNMTSKETSYSDAFGNFSMMVQDGDELRFVKNGFERTEKRIYAENFDHGIRISLIKLPMEIEEVKVLPLSGNLAKDSRKLTQPDRLSALQKSIGVPAPPEKPREKPAEVASDVLLPIVFGQLNVQAVYDLISGKARRQKHLYQYEDLQENIRWIESKIDQDYFEKIGIKPNEINVFLAFSISERPDILKWVKAKNVSLILLEIEITSKIYLERAKKTNSPEKC